MVTVGVPLCVIFKYVSIENFERDRTKELYPFEHHEWYLMYDTLYYKITIN